MQGCSCGLAHIVWCLLVGVVCEKQVAGILNVTILECLFFPSAEVSL